MNQETDLLHVFLAAFAKFRKGVTDPHQLAFVDFIQPMLKQGHRSRPSGSPDETGAWRVEK
jgi:hypothetical protein